MNPPSASPLLLVLPLPPLDGAPAFPGAPLPSVQSRGLIVGERMSLNLCGRDGSPLPTVASGGN